MDRISKPRQKFIEHILLLYMGLKCRYTFLNMSRFGRYSDRSYRFHFGRYFDFLSFNVLLCQGLCETDYVLAFDPSYIRKSGKFTAHVDRFFHSSVMRPMRGLEVGVLALVDRVRKTAFPLEAVQTHSLQSLKQEGKSLVDHYAQIIVDRKDQLRNMAKYLVVDGFFAKNKFLHPILQKTELQIITLLRRDTHLQYLAPAQSPGKRGRPKKYDGKIDFQTPDLAKMQLVLDSERALNTASGYLDEAG
ncbi:MAG: transposase, partial [Bacteroidota bacterium]